MERWKKLAFVCGVVVLIVWFLTPGPLSSCATNWRNNLYQYIGGDLFGPLILAFCLALLGFPLLACRQTRLRSVVRAIGILLLVGSALAVSYSFFGKTGYWAKNSVILKTMQDSIRMLELSYQADGAYPAKLPDVLDRNFLRFEHDYYGFGNAYVLRAKLDEKCIFRLSPEYVDTIDFLNQGSVRGVDCTYPYICVSSENGGERR